jgi:hypothetical protein
LHDIRQLLKENLRDVIRLNRFDPAVNEPQRGPELNIVPG